MKTIIITALAFVLLSMSSVCQAKKVLKLDSTVLGLALTPPESYAVLPDAITNNIIGKSIGLGKSLKLPNLKGKAYVLNAPPVPNPKEQKSFYNMPCINPKINSNMPIAMPDSTIRYTLGIKWIE